ncbi:transcription initiation factor IID, 18kD subunit-domain-containing protein [Clohesyomyces aquaticus]|uniref:Transcription initiation factor IID, 18kD subunit-domain-containing protein n=1 Tax=Clohesyomyces aquaticus TaxID=1231657 RepID=A0A1Y1Z1X3_9PLEO|nr:transcription initiation factor IID, 18kD subunit-domain-containing protein [Clohesyomyces aquaticus]
MLAFKHPCKLAPFELTDLIQMMFVSGETGEPAAETTTLIESIVQDQVQHMLRECSALATRRGSRAISTDDLFMLIRHDRAKISRLRHFLQWKDVRRSVKDSDDKGGDAGADVAAGDADLAAGVVAGGGGPGPEPGKKAKRAKVDLVWEVQSFFNENPPAKDDVEDEEEEEMNFATLQRLKNADERTKNMTREEYVHWSDCRQASFTYRKGKRFKEWAGFGVITDSKPSDDIIDILGFLTFEIVQTLTEEALKVKAAEDLYKKTTGGKPENRLKRKRERGLFDPPEEAREPVQPSHVQEAYRRLQRGNNKARAMLNFTRSVHRAALKLI